MEGANSARNLIDLIDEGDNYVSKNVVWNERNEGNSFDHDVHVQRQRRPETTVATSFNIEDSNVPIHFATIASENNGTQFIFASLNNFQQFNYQHRNEIVDITDENEREYLFDKVPPTQSHADVENNNNNSMQSRPFVQLAKIKCDECMNATAINEKGTEIISNDGKIIFDDNALCGGNFACNNRCDDKSNKIKRLKEHEEREISSEFYRYEYDNCCANSTDECQG
jgi:hypothetical protein